MNGWYGAAIAGMVLLIEGLVNLIVSRIGKQESEEQEPKKQEPLDNAIRASSGGLVLILAYLSIHFKWFGADIVVSYNPFYSFGFAGVVLMLESFFSFVINVSISITKRRKGEERREREWKNDARRAYIGIGIFFAGLIALFISGG
jgi:hypothetical protein